MDSNSGGESTPDGLGRALERRWYVALPGLLIAVGVAAAVFSGLTPQYERTATAVVIPAAPSLPENVFNPYMYLGPMTSAADVVARAAESGNTARALNEEFPGSSVSVQRDNRTGVPLMYFTVTAPNDWAAGGAVNALMERTTADLNDLQDSTGVPEDLRAQFAVVTVDEQSTELNQRRYLTAGLVAFGTLLISVLLTALLDGWIRAKRAARSANITVNELGDPEIDPGGDGASDGVRDAQESQRR